MGKSKKKTLFFLCTLMINFIWGFASYSIQSSEKSSPNLKNKWAWSMKINSKWARVDKLKSGNRLQEALSLANQLLQQTPNSIVGYYQRSEIHKAMGNYNMVIEDLTKIINITSHMPALFHCLLRRGRRLWFDGQYDRALSDMNRAIALNPDSQVGYDFRSVINWARGSSLKAIKDMEHSQKINPKGSVSYFHLGCFYHEKGRKDKAKLNFFKAREYNPKIITMFRNRQKQAMSPKTRNFYRKEMAVAREYLEGQPSTGASSPKNISLQIISMNIRPAIVRPGSKFELMVDFVVVDPTAGQNQIPIKFSYEINIGKKVLYQSETKIITSPNGIVRGQVVQLKASRNRGFYNIEALLKYKNQRTKKHTTFEIGEPKKTPPLKSSKKIDF